MKINEDPTCISIPFAAIGQGQERFLMGLAPMSRIQSQDTLLVL